jgi:uncharacterized membrane protein
MVSPFALIKSSIIQYKKNAVTYLGYAAWTLIPATGIILLQIAPKTPMTFLILFLLTITEIFLWVWISIIIIQLTTSTKPINKLDQNKLQISSIQKMHPLIWVGFIELLIIAGGTILLIIPGLIFMVWYAFAQLSVVLDNKRGMKALSYSRDLVKGRFLYTAYSTILIPILMMLVYLMIFSIITTPFFSMSGQTINDILELNAAPMWLQSLQIAGDVLFMPLIIIYTTKLYQHMKDTYNSTGLEKGSKIA